MSNISKIAAAGKVLPLLLCLWLMPTVTWAQSGLCEASTPFFNVDLRGQPTGIFNTPNVSREDECCGGPSNENCVEFEVYLDAQSIGLVLDITAGPQPGGNAFYNVDCGPDIAVADTAFLSGPGPFTVTLCMPGDAINQFSIYAIGSMQVSIVGPSVLCDGATALLEAQATAGSGNYSYLWDTGETTPAVTKPAGDYSVEVTDNITGQKEVAKISIVPTVGPNNIITNSNPATCGVASGVIGVTQVVGGTSPYSYSLDDITYQSSPIFNNLLPGTYAIYVQDANGCKDQTSVTVAAVTGPTDLQVSTTPAACGNNNGSIIVNNVTGGTAPYEYSIDGINFQSSNTFSGLAAGSYPVGVRDSNGCRYNTSTTVANAGGPTGITYSIVTASCSDDDGEIRVISVDNGTSPYQYSIDGVNFQSSSDFTGLASGNYTLTARDANACIYSVAVTVTSEAPSSLLATSTSASCSLPNGTIVVQSVNGGTAPYTFSINGSLYQTSPSFMDVAPGTYTVTARDDRGCLVTTEVTVGDVTGPIDLQITTSGATCGDANGSLAVDLVVGGTTPYQYSLDGINFQASNQFVSIRSGAYNITVRDANNCQYSEVVGVSDTPGPSSASFTTNEALCNNNTGTLTVDQVVGGAAPFTYAIDNGPFQASPTLVNIPGGAHILSVKDANGCVLAVNVTIANTQGPADFNFLVSQASCGSSNGVVTITSVVGGTAPNMYAINGGSFQSGLSFGGLAAGSHVITVRDNNGCLLSKNIIVTNSGGPGAITYMINESNCDSNDGSIQVTSVFGGDLPYEFSLDGVNYQPSASFSGLAFGDYVVYVRDNQGCIYLEPVTVPANGPDNVTFVLAHSLCNLSTGSLTVSNVVGGTAPYQYSIDGSNYQISTNFSNLSQGMYQLYVRDDKGCILIEDFEITDVPGPQDLDYTVMDATCGDGNGSITIDNIIGGTAPFQYSLDSGPYQAGASFANLFSGLYNITVLDANNCSLTISIQVNNQTGPLANLQSTTSVTCFGGSDGVVEVSASSGGTLEYSINNGTTFQTSPIFNGLAAGNYTVIVRDQSGCSSSVDSITLNQPELLQAEATISKQPNTGLSDGIIELSNIEGGVPPYSSFLNGETMGPETRFENLAAGPYTISLVDQNQCQISFELLIESEFPEIEVPNGFTPNGDGRNDTWEISQLSQFYPNAEVRVFNRWGQVVYSSTGYSNPWNGTRGGQQLPTTTYYYLIKLNEGQDPLQGTVTIIR